MTTTRKSISLAILAACLLLTKTTQASFVAITAPNSNPSVVVGGPDTASTDATVGYEFQVGPTNLPVTALGMWDESLTVGGGGGGLLVPAQVAIWDTTAGNPLLVSATVPTGTAGTTVVGDYRYVSVPTTELLAGHEYIAGAYVLHNLYHGSTTSASDVTFGTPNVSYITRLATLSAFAVPSSLSAPTDSAWDAPNFQFALPEPTSLALGAIAMLGLVVRRLVRHG